MGNRRCRAAGEAGDHRVKAAPLALIPCANRCAGDGAFERGKPAAGIAGIAENPVGAPTPRRFAGEVARQAGGGVTGRKGGKVGKVGNPARTVRRTRCGLAQIGRGNCANCEDPSGSARTTALDRGGGRTYFAAPQKRP